MGLLGSAAKVGRGLLDMSAPARKQRAEDMGFNKDLYHKTWSDTFEETGFDSFDPNKMQGSDYGYAGKGVYTTPEPLGGTTYGNVTMPLKTNIKNPYVMTKENFQDELTPYQWIPANADNYGGLSQASSAWTKMMQDKGYDGFVDKASKNGEVVVFEPSNLRSKFAKFDPANSQSSSLTASNPAATAAAGAGGLLAMTGSDDSEAGVVGKAAKGILDMATPARMARADEQRYNTDVYHGSTHNVKNMDASITNIEGDWGQGIYSSNNIDDVNANYARIGPDLTSRIERRMDNIDSELDGYEFEDLINSFPEMTKKEAKAIAAGDSEIFEVFKRRIATKEIAGPNDGVVYPLKLKSEDYVVIDQKKPTYIEGRDYQAEAADDLNRSDFDNDDDYEDALYELADEMQADDYDSPLATISETLSRAGVDGDKIGEITQDFYGSESINAFDLDSAIRSAEIYLDDDMGNMIPNGAISAQVFRDLGYKGVKDNTVNAKFPTMKGMNRNTTHYITFPDNEQTIRSVNAAFDPAKANSTSILASNPAAGAGAGVLGAIGASQSNKTYADYSPANLARLRSNDVGSIQAPQSMAASNIAGLMGSANKVGYDDSLLGMVAPQLPSELMNKIAYNDKRGLMDYAKAYAGLLGF